MKRTAPGYTPSYAVRFNGRTSRPASDMAGKRKKIVTRRPRFSEAVAWIAENDEASEVNIESIAGYISTLLVADLFGADPAEVAAAVSKYRSRRDARGDGCNCGVLSIRACPVHKE